MHRNDFNIIVGKAITKVKTGIYTYKQYSYGINKEQNNLFIGNTNTGDIYQASFGMLIYVGKLEPAYTIKNKLRELLEQK